MANFKAPFGDKGNDVLQSSKGSEDDDYHPSCSSSINTTSCLSISSSSAVSIAAFRHSIHFCTFASLCIFRAVVSGPSNARLIPALRLFWTAFDTFRKHFAVSCECFLARVSRLLARVDQMYSRSRITIVTSRGDDRFRSHHLFRRTTICI